MSIDHRLDYEDPWQATAALLFLMTQWSQSRSSRLIPLIIEHLCILERHGSPAVSSIMRDICIGVQDKWLSLDTPSRRDHVDSVDDGAVNRPPLLH